MPRTHRYCDRPGKERVGLLGSITCASIYLYSGILSQAKLKERVRAPWGAILHSGRTAYMFHMF